MVAPTELSAPARAVIEQAAMWQAQLADENCGEEDRRAFSDWLAADPAHRIAFERMDRIAGRASGQDAVGRTALQGLLSGGSRKHAALLVALLACAGLGWWVVHNPAIRAGIASERSDIGEIRDAEMATGDRLTLDSDSAADPDDASRTVRLWRGGIMAQVESGQAKPFVILTEHGSARAIGTRFGVHVRGDATIVTVIESEVEACAAQGTKNCVTLKVGQSARLDSRGVSRLPKVDPAIAVAWSAGMLVSDDRPLAGVLDELNRYRRDPIRYRAADLAGLRITGVFPLMDTDRALTSIEAALPVAVARDGDEVSVSRK